MSSDRVPVELTQAVARFEKFDGERAAVLARLVHAVADLAESCDGRVIREVAGASSNERVLVEVLNKAPPSKADPLAAARMRGVQARRQLLAAEGGLLSAEELGDALGITRQAVDKRRKGGKLLAVEAGGRGLGYPAWQVHDGETLYGLEEVLGAIEADSPVALCQFFLTPAERLGGKRPLDLLRRRQRLKDVLLAARSLDIQGAP